MRKDIKVGIGIAGFVAVGALAVIGGNMQDGQKAEAAAVEVVNVADHPFMKRCDAALASKTLKLQSRRDDSDICACVTPKIAAKVTPNEVEASADLLETVFMQSRLRSAPVSEDKVKNGIVTVKTRHGLTNVRLNEIMGNLNTSLKSCAVEERVQIDTPKAPRPVARPRPNNRDTQSTGKSNSFETQREDERAATEEQNIGRADIYQKRRD